MAGPFLDELFSGYSGIWTALTPVTPGRKFLNFSSSFTVTDNPATAATDVSLNSSVVISATGLELGYFRIYEDMGNAALLASQSLGLVGTDAVGLQGGGAGLTLASAGIEFTGADVSFETGHNVSLNGGSNPGGGLGVLAVANVTTPPGSVSGGGVLYADAGAGKWKGSGGTTTTFGPADPHCPRCGNDYVFEWTNETRGHHLAICFTCLVSAIKTLGLDPSSFAFVNRT